MAEDIIVRVRKDLDQARKRDREVQAKTRKMQEGRAAEAVRRRRSAPPIVERDRPEVRRGRLRAGQPPRAGGVRGRIGAGISKAAIAAAIAGIALELMSKITIPILEQNAGILAKDKNPLVARFGKALKAELEKRRIEFEKLKSQITATFSAASQTIDSVKGSALLDSPVGGDEVIKTFEARRKVAYLREASKNVIDSSLNAKAVKSTLDALGAHLAKNVAGQKGKK